VGAPRAGVDPDDSGLGRGGLWSNGRRWFRAYRDSEIRRHRVDRWHERPWPAWRQHHDHADHARGRERPLGHRGGCRGRRSLDGDYQHGFAVVSTGLKNSGTLTREVEQTWCGVRVCQTRDGVDANALSDFFKNGYEEEGQQVFLTTDHLGSARDVVDAEGALNSRYDYDPFGRRYLTSGTYSRLLGTLVTDF